MEVTALKGSSGDVQHFADRIIAEPGVRYSRVAMILTSAKTKRRLPAYLTIETPVTVCAFRVKSAASTAGWSLLVSPDKRTSSVSVGMSQTCQ